MFDFSLSPLTLSFSPSLSCHFALWDIAETHSLFILPLSLSRIHLPCARATETAFKVETCLQPLSYPIYSTLSNWNYFPQSNMTFLLIIPKQLPAVFLLKSNLLILAFKVLDLLVRYHLIYFTLAYAVSSSGQTYALTSGHLPHLVRHRGDLLPLELAPDY